MLSTLYHMPLMNYALCSPLYPICHLWPYALWQLCIYFHLSCLIHLRPLGHLIRYDNLTTLPLRTSEVLSDVWSNSEVLSPPEPQHPWNHDDMSFIRNIISASGHSSTMMRSQLRTHDYVIHSDICQLRIPGHPSFWRLVIPKCQLCYPIQISYQLQTPVLLIIESAWSSGWIPLTKFFSED